MEADTRWVVSWLRVGAALKLHAAWVIGGMFEGQVYQLRYRYEKRRTGAGWVRIRFWLRTGTRAQGRNWLSVGG